ncbi:ADP-ribosylglycohydrolase family protein [Streptomyces sp. NPDC003011]
MNGPWTLERVAVYRARVRGCLLGGAVGDALGYPVEFSSLDRIRATHGPRGVSGPVPGAHGAVGLISDDTQMTLFTAEALIQDREGERHRAPDKGVSDGWSLLMRRAYERWLETQTKPGPEQAAPPGTGQGAAAGPAPAATPDGDAPVGGLVTERWLYARRAPGNACLSGVAQGYAPDPWLVLDGRPGEVNPDSKGCGAVMRSAPFGLVHRDDVAFSLAARAAQITHGHPTGYYAAGALAAIVANLVEGDSMQGSVLRALRTLERHPGHEETSAALSQAVELAADPTGATAEKVESLGAGWVAEEALAIGVYCALLPMPVEDALLLSVNHSGDSDSTGSLCGNLLGARHGDQALPHAWVQRVEGRARIAVLADDLAAQGVPA